MITPRSRVISAASKTGFRTRSLRMSSAVGTCSSSTLTLKQIHSLEVKASILPPMESTWRAISSAVRCLVPLKTMCSIKWEMPFDCGVSSREPVSSQIPMEAERMCSICSVITVRPCGNTWRRILRTSFTMMIARVELLQKYATILTHLAGCGGVCENKMVNDLESVGCRYFSGAWAVHIAIGSDTEVQQ